MSHRLEPFKKARPRLLALAYRMLGSAAEAEEVVQDAYIRWMTSRPVEEVRSPVGYLARVVTRLCLDRLDHARVERAYYEGPWLPEPVSAAQSPDWAAALERAEEVSFGFLMVLEKLSPLERAVLILHDMFDHTHKEIADTLRRSESACRQLLRRAREHVREEEQRFEASTAEHARLMKAFIDACTSGRVDTLKELLTEDVVFISDGGGRTAAVVRPVIGDDPVARLFIGFMRLKGGLHIRTETVNGSPMIVVRHGDGRVEDVICLVADGHRIRRVFAVRNPDKLTRLPPHVS